jgi:predicted 3-demethylubiquinone-9 3-methyltransferase (glyoxalase superfamily)
MVRRRFFSAVSNHELFGAILRDAAKTQLSDGGAIEQCGWLKDRYGVSWQIVPTVLPQLLGGPDAAGAQRAMQAMLKMVKLDIAALQKAYAGG